MSKHILLALAFVSLITSCKDEPDRAAAFEGTYKAPTPYVNYDRVKVTKVDRQTISMVYTLKDSAQFVLISQASFTSDSTVAFDGVSSIGSSVAKYAVKGTASIYVNRLVVQAQAVNTANELDFYNIPFEGFK